MYYSRSAAEEAGKPDPTSGGQRTQTRESLGSPPGAQAARPFRSRSVRRAMLSIVGSRFNPIVMKLAGGGRLQSVAMVHPAGCKIKSTSWTYPLVDPEIVD
jgi:hypothetical protein